MIIAIKAMFGLFWIIASSFLIYLMYIVLQTEGNPNILWAWITMSGLTFAAATFLAYIIILKNNNPCKTESGENKQ